MFTPQNEEFAPGIWGITTKRKLESFNPVVFLVRVVSFRERKQKT